MSENRWGLSRRGDWRDDHDNDWRRHRHDEERDRDHGDDHGHRCDH
ncbi:MAG: hypothetical protein QOI75_6958 [Pseudonocardiales bacterium]|jgi:hypothetical protein|nr:hypothetical protein [Pseudonocardiales bacterium]